MPAICSNFRLSGVPISEVEYETDAYMNVREGAEPGAHAVDAAWGAVLIDVRAALRWLPPYGAQAPSNGDALAMACRASGQPVHLLNTYQFGYTLPLNGDAHTALRDELH